MLSNSAQLYCKIISLIIYNKFLWQNTLKISNYINMTFKMYSYAMTWQIKSKGLSLG